LLDETGVPAGPAGGSASYNIDLSSCDHLNEVVNRVFLNSVMPQEEQYPRDPVGLSKERRSDAKGHTASCAGRCAWSSSNSRVFRNGHTETIPNLYPLGVNELLSTQPERHVVDAAGRSSDAARA
jgi:hypothetical protein